MLSRIDWMLVAQSCLTATAWTVTPQALLSMEFSRQEYWNGLPFPSPGGVFLSQRLNLSPLALQAEPLLSAPPGKQ